METRQLTCIGCPLGCQLTVTLEDGKEPVVAGYTCKRGEAYGKKEVTDPTRTVTSSVRVTGGEIAMASVKTRTDIPRDGGNSRRHHPRAGGAGAGHPAGCRPHRRGGHRHQGGGRSRVTL